MLDGFGIAGFRSFGNPVSQRVGPMEKIHLVAGPNNSGKSNVLKVAAQILSTLRGERIRTKIVVGDLDVPIGPPDETERQIRISLRAPLDDETLEDWIKVRPKYPAAKFRELLAGTNFRPDPDGVWIEYVLDEGRWRLSPNQAAEIEAVVQSSFGPDEHRWLERIVHQLGAGGQGSSVRRVLAAVESKLAPRTLVPGVASIGAFRQIAASKGDDDGHDGFGLIDRLAQLQNPGHAGADDRRRFEQINQFLRSLIGDGDAQIEIPHNRKTIEVFHEGVWLPLENYGTGLHEVVILAAAATVLSGKLVCIEEPEIHLHPTLQRKLLRYLSEVTDNQYLIATHSAHMLDFGTASITAVRSVDGRSELSPAIDHSEVAAISFELGARASDLVQANSVVWVEGQSDRIYLRRWIHALNADLVEGVHFSILTYGGRLLAHFSADDKAVEEFIRLPRINRHFAILIDSDRTGPGEGLGATKTRIRKEIEAVPGSVAWITQGYTIENYVPTLELASAVNATHPESQWKWDGDKFKNPLGKAAFPGRKSDVDKIAIAQAVAETPMSDDAWILDLKSRVRKLVQMIEAANV